MKTPKGTPLTLITLRGKDYLQVQQRLVWFVEEKPDWSIGTEALHLTDDSAYFRATIRDESGRIRATAHKYENNLSCPVHFREKAETSAIGRALAFVGFGTQFCGDELDEGENIVDAPVDKKSPIESIDEVPVESIDEVPVESIDEVPVESIDEVPVEKKSPTEIRIIDKAAIENYKFDYGKHNGKKLVDLDVYELTGYVEWLKAKVQSGTLTGRLRSEAPIIIKMIEKFLKTREYAIRPGPKKERV
jgi:hypothetical protein